MYDVATVGMGDGVEHRQEDLQSVVEIEAALGKAWVNEGPSTIP